MGQWLHLAGGNRQHRIEQAGRSDALRLGGQLEVGGRCIEWTPGRARDFDQRFVGAEQIPLAETAGCRSIGECYGVPAVPLGSEHSDRIAGDDSGQPLSGAHVF